MQVNTMQQQKRQQVSVAVMISSQSKLLVVRRSQREAFLPGIFELPGGKVEFGESPSDAVMREVAEETGLRIKNMKLIDARSYMSKGDAQHNVELFYIGTVDGTNHVTLSDAHDEFRWIGEAEIPALGLPTDDPVRLAIEQYFETQ